MNTLCKAVRRSPCVSLLLFLAALGIHFHHPLRLALIYDRGMITNGGIGIMRLVSSHMVHLNTDHFFWSGLTFLGLGSACEIINKKAYYVTLVVSAVMIPIIIYCAMPKLQVYAGLSGIDCALYTLMLSILLKQEVCSGNRLWLLIYGIMLLLLVFKAAYEILTGSNVFVSNTHIEMTTVPFAHLAGGFLGCLIGFSTKK